MTDSPGDVLSLTGLLYYESRL